jgi:hypothetical protein
VVDNRIERFNVLCGAVAEKLGSEPGDDAVQYVAQLKLKREDLLARDLAGDRVDVADLKWIADALAKYESITAPVRAELTISHSKCPECGWQRPEVRTEPGESITDAFRRQRIENEPVEARTERAE